MSWEVFAWTALWSAGSWWLGYRFGKDRACRNFSYVLWRCGVRDIDADTYTITLGDKP